MHIPWVSMPTTGLCNVWIHLFNKVSLGYRLQVFWATEEASLPLSPGLSLEDKY